VITLVVALLGVGGYLGIRQWQAWSHYRRAEEALAVNQLEEGRRQLNLCLEIWSKDGKAHFLAARTARRLGDSKACERHLDLCKQQGWDARQVRLERTLLRVQRDSPGQDESVLLTLVQAGDADSSYILEALVQGFLKNYQLPKAYECAQLWLRREPDNPRALYWRAMAQKEMLSRTPAIDDLCLAIEADSDFREARLRLGELLLDQGRHDDAVAQYEWLYERDSQNTEVLMGLAQCRVAQGRLDEAQNLLDPLLRDHPKSPLVLGESGKLAMKQGNTASAEDLLHRSVDLDPYDPEMLYAYSQILAQRGKPEEAKKWLDAHERVRADLKRLVQLNAEIVEHPNEASPRCEVGLIFIRTGSEQKGLRWLLDSLQRDPNYRPAHLALADYFERKGNAPQAAYHRQQAGSQ
jgi:tetratricopeptide (TPR) repeat protein